MKIGIITYYNVVNYGAVLLAYAMKKTLNEFGHEVVFLKFNRKKIEIKNQKDSLNMKLRRLSPNARKAAKLEKKKNEEFEIFRENYLKEGDYYNIPQELDLIIVGSDQIFDCKYEFNEYQFAIGAACENVISYAPSFGEFKVEDISKYENKKKLEDALCKFKKLCARDRNTEEVIKLLTGKRVPRVLDPVLLYGFGKEKIEWNERLVKERYLIVYAWGGTTNSEEFKENVSFFAKKNGLKSVSIGDWRPWCDINYASATPIEFFKLYRHCDMIITNMFHGTCFSIVNEKPFYSVVMPHNENKLRDLLQFLKLEKQIIKDIGVLKEKELPGIDYLAVNCFLEEQRKVSWNYLYEGLEDVKVPYEK